MTTEVFAYVGIAQCGCVRAMTVDNPEHAKDVRRNVREFMRYGPVERWPIERVRVQFCLDKHPTRGKAKGCPHPGACPYRQQVALGEPDAVPLG